MRRPRSGRPKTPEEILALKVCDPACGSGTFPGRRAAVPDRRALRLAPSSRAHLGDGDRAVVRLLDQRAAAAMPEELLGRELLPCRPDDALFEPRLKALLRRHVVERCIYGVDLDPLAVELCRLALWIETMDRDLPFSFLDHKIKCGNSLVGAWFDTVPALPGDGVEEPRGRRQEPHQRRALREGGAHEGDQGVRQGHADAGPADVPRGPNASLTRTCRSRRATVHTPMRSPRSLALHDLPVHDSAERARVYREELVGSAAYQSLKAAMDLWCACWFWPADDLEHAPLPTTLAAPPEETRAVAERVARRKRFFHWELEFPDVFNAEARVRRDSRQSAVGTLQPNSKEFFSNIDPLYRSYGKQEALGDQTEYFRRRRAFEQEVARLHRGLHERSRTGEVRARPFGDPDRGRERAASRSSIERGSENARFTPAGATARARVTDSRPRTSVSSSGLGGS